MKKITLALIALTFSFAIKAQTIISGSSTPDVIDGGVFCGAGALADLDAFRAYVLTDFGITDAFQINAVQYGAGPDSVIGAPAEGITVTITIYTTDAPFPTGTLTEIASTTDVLFEGDGGVVRDVPIDALIPAGSEFVIETAYPNDGFTNITVGSGGTNVNGNIAWLRSVDCLGNADIRNLADFGLSNAWIINAVGEETLSLNNQVLSDSVSLFPNPTNGDLNLNFGSSFGTLDVKIINVSGQEVMSQPVEGVGSVSLPTSKLSNGVYFAQISNESSSTTIKFIKN